MFVGFLFCLTLDAKGSDGPGFQAPDRDRFPALLALAVLAGVDATKRVLDELELLALAVGLAGFAASFLFKARLAAAAAVVFAIWRVGRDIVANWRRLLVLGVINTAVPFTLFAFAALTIPSGVNSLLNATTPIFGALIARFWLGEMLSARRWIGILLSFAGVGEAI